MLFEIAMMLFAITISIAVSYDAIFNSNDAISNSK